MSLSRTLSRWRSSRVVRRVLLWIGALALAALLAQVAAAQDQWRFTGVPRVVAFADVHGAYRQLVDLLQATGVLNPDLEWVGGDAHLVSVGDLLDRGPDSRAVMDLLMRLQHEAAEQGGAVHVVLGNHELMNLLGDLRYVASDEYAAFADDEPQEVRERALERFAAEQPAGDADVARAAFERRYPPGYFGHRQAFSAHGRYGSWLLSLPALIVVNGTAFVHGGLPELVAQASLEELNGRVRQTTERYLALRDELEQRGFLPEQDMERDVELARAALEEGTPADDEAALLREFLELNDAPVLGSDGPLWYRGAVYCNPLVEEDVLDRVLTRLDAQRVVVGHTVTDDRRVRSLFEGRLVMLDTGMLASYYAGRPAALILEEGGVAVQYLDPRERALPEAGAVEAYGLTEAQLLEALLNGALEADDSGAAAAGAQALRVRYADRELRATFRPQDRRGGGRLELAAYALDRLLGLHLVPPTVAREIGGQEGALQLRYADAISETERVERRLPLGAWCAIEPQLALMYAFDLLTYNVGRTHDTVLYRHSVSALKLIGHHEAFGTQRRVTVPGDSLALPPTLTSALAALDEQALQRALGRWLDERQIRALLARRDAIVAP